jgi:hypothetical protein
VSVFLSVLVVAVVHTGYEYTPLFFLSIAEYNVGQVDAEVMAGTWTNNKYLNYSKFRSHLATFPPAASGPGAGGAGAGAGADSGDALLFNYSAPRRRFDDVAVWAAAACDKTLLDPLDKAQRYLSRN